MSRLAIGALLVLGSLTPFAAQTPVQQAPVAAPAEPTVTVLSTGAAPRTALRYSIPKDYKEHLNMKMAMGMAMDMQGMEMPAMTMPVMNLGADMAVTEVSAAGDITVAMTFTNFDLEQTPGVDPSVMAMLQASDPGIKGLQGTVTLTNRGVSHGAVMDTSKLANPQMAQVLDSMSESFRNFSSPFPEEPIGLGAKWQVKQPLTSGGLQTQMVSTYELTGFDGKTAAMKVTMEQSAEPQSFMNPALPAGADVQLQHFAGSGTGTFSVPLTGLVPTSEMNSQLEMTMSVSANGSDMSMHTTNTIR